MSRQKAATKPGDYPEQNQACHCLQVTPRRLVLFRLRACEKMGTGSGPAMQNPDNIADWPVPVPIFSQASDNRPFIIAQ